MARIARDWNDRVCDDECGCVTYIWRPSTVGYGAPWWKAENGTSECVKRKKNSVAEVDRIRSVMRSVLNEVGWVDEVTSGSKGGFVFVFFFCVFMMAERSRCEDFESVLEQVSGRAHSG